MSRRIAFTLVETVGRDCHIGILVALLLPAIQARVKLLAAIRASIMCVKLQSPRKIMSMPIKGC